MVSLNKITLEKKGDSHKIDLSKSTDQQITINLNWTQQKPSGFFSSLFGSDKEIDQIFGVTGSYKTEQLHLLTVCNFPKVVAGQENANTPRMLQPSTLVWHCGDDRNGSSAEGENILVNPKGIRDLRRLVIYCFIYEGAAKWAESDAVVTVKVPNQPEIVVEMGKQTDPRTFCAIATIDFEDTQMSVRKDINFFNGHADCSQYYGWGFNFSAGSK